jgi:DnaJ-class molecular chaperone
MLSNKKVGCLIKSRTQCENCKGSGFIKTETIICSHCNGTTCGYCNKKGHLQAPWGLCDKCNGDGEFITYVTDQPDS